jgi:hypothetical protein
MPADGMLVSHPPNQPLHASTIKQSEDREFEQRIIAARQGEMIHGRSGSKPSRDKRPFVG